MILLLINILIVYGKWYYIIMVVCIWVDFDNKNDKFMKPFYFLY